MLWWWIACAPPGAAPPVEVVPDARPVVEPDRAVVAYRVGFDEAQAHRVSIEAGATCPASGTLDWWMAVWTPGSYLVREFARHVEHIEAVGEGTDLHKVAKNRWRSTCSPGAPVGIRYTLYARLLSVRESFVERDLGMLNGAATFVLPDLEGPIEVRLSLPESWSTVQTSLPPHPSGEVGRFLAPNVDTLFDAPVLLGNPDVRTFEVQGVTHQVVTLGPPGPFDHARAAADIERLTQATTAFWGQIPYPSYRFLTVLAEKRGGLEHLDNTLMMTSRWSTSKRADRLRFLGLVSHELFHAWNVKRLRPAGLGPFDYEHEVHTPSLWIAEGLTSYYDDVLLSRAGLLTEAEYLERMSQNVASVQRAPGRAFQSLSEASFDAWIKYYRGDENSPNHTVSYYTKGALVGWLLDAHIRRATRSGASLDDVMREMWARYRTTPYTPSDFRQVASEVAGSDLSAFFEHHVDGTGELDYGGALQWWGLRWAESAAPESEDPQSGWLGVQTRSTGGRLVISEVLRDTPAWAAGLNVGDEIIAVDDERITTENLATRLGQLGVGHEGTWLIARRGHLLRVPVTLGAPSDRSWKLEPDPGASPIATRRRGAWLRGDRGR